MEVACQPSEGFGVDAAIMFSGMLEVPHALGRDVRFEEDRGPLLTPITAAEIEALESKTFHVNLEPVYETVRRLRAKLPDETTLIGFCGAPWTVATYMIAGHGTPDQAPARLFAYREPEAFQHLLKVLADHSAAYLMRQIEAGADVVQIFDSWSGVLDDARSTFCVWPVAGSSGSCASIDVRSSQLSRAPAPASPIARRLDNGLGIDWTVPLAAKGLQLVVGGKARSCASWLARALSKALNDPEAVGDGPRSSISATASRRRRRSRMSRRW